MESLLTKLEELIGFPVSITISHSISLKGYVLEVKSDYLHFKNRNGLTQFIQIKGIKEIVKNSKENTILSDDLLESPLNKEEKFKDLLKSFKEKWLLAARTNLDYLQGVLCDVYEDSAVFIDKERLIFVPLSNIDYVQDRLEEDVLNHLKKDSKEKSEGSSKGLEKVKVESNEKPDEPFENQQRVPGNASHGESKKESYPPRNDVAQTRTLLNNFLETLAQKAANC